MTTGTNDADYGRMLWASRRGLLELDLWLLPLQKAWPDLTAQDKHKVLEFLQQSDEVLWDIFLQNSSVLEIIYS